MFSCIVLSLLCMSVMRVSYQAGYQFTACLLCLIPCETGESILHGVNDY